MAVTKVERVHQRKYSKNVQGNQTASDMYLVWTNADYEDLDSLVADAITAGLPDLNDSYSGSSPSLVVTKHVPKVVGTELRFYHIEVIYNSDQLSFAFPTSQPWKIEFSAILQEWVPDKTNFSTIAVLPAPVVGVANGKPILNTAAFPFDPTVTDFRTLVGIKLRKNFTNISDIGSVANIAALMAFNNKVNSDTLTIAGIAGSPYQFWAEQIFSRNTEENGESFYEAVFDIVYDENYHIQRVLNAGYMDVFDTIIKGDKGGDITQPWPLDAAGAAIRGGAAARAAAAIYRGFGIKETATLASLGLPTVY